MPNITTNHAIICLYYYPQKVCNFQIWVFQINTTALSQSNCRNFSCSPVKTNSSCRALATCKLQTSFSPLVQPDNLVVQKFDTRKIYKLWNEVIFFAPFFVCFFLFAFKLGVTAKLCLHNWFIY